MDAPLRACARKRREDAGAPLELPPATRRRLQAEVARTHGGIARAPRAGWRGLLAFWPRLALATALFLVLGAVVWRFRPPPAASEQTVRFAKQDAAAPPPKDLRDAASDGMTPAPAAAKAEQKMLDEKIPPALFPANPPPSAPSLTTLDGTQNSPEKSKRGSEADVLSPSPSSARRGLADTAPARARALLPDESVEELRSQVGRTAGQQESLPTLKTPAFKPEGGGAQLAKPSLVKMQGRPVSSPDEVAGVAASDLSVMQELKTENMIAANPASGLSFSGPSVAIVSTTGTNGSPFFRWSFPQPPPGYGAVDFAASNSEMFRLATNQTLAFGGGRTVAGAELPKATAAGTRSDPALSRQGDLTLARNATASATIPAGERDGVALATDVGAMDKPMPALPPANRQAGDRAKELALTKEKSASGLREGERVVSLGVASGRGSRQRFTQEPPLASAGRGSGSKPEILENFEMEQAGATLRIIDADGSIYTGQLLEGGAGVAGGAEGGGRKMAEIPSPGAKAAAQPSLDAKSGVVRRAVTAGTAFRVAGTNRTVNQLVVLEGALLPETWDTSSGVNEPPRAAERAPVPQADRLSRVTVPGGSTNTLNAGRIQGQMRVGGAGDVPFNARRAHP